MFGLTGEDPWNNFPGDPRSRYRGQPFFVSEFGGIRVKTDRDVGQGWGYGEVDLQGFLERYKGLATALLDNPNIFGFCYTQLTDIEQEQNGIYFYDRQPKYDPALVRTINVRPAAYETQPPRRMRIKWETILPTAEEEAGEWRYTTEEPAGEWMKPDFDDSDWRVGKAGFGIPETPGAIVGTRWDTKDIWLRRRFRLAEATFAIAALRIHHDEDAEVYLNGEPVGSFSGFVQNYFTALPSEAVARALRAGENLLAVHCRQTVGGQFIDVGIIGSRQGPVEERK